MEDGARVVGKFYRPGRWTKGDILEDHQFLHDEAGAEVHVVEQLKLKNGSTLVMVNDEILYSVFQKVRGRAPEELQDEQVQQIGRLIGRLHNVGVTKKAPQRVCLTPETYGRGPLDFLISNNWLPIELSAPYKNSRKYS